MDNKLEEIRKRDAKVTLEEPIGARLLACSDRRWLLGEVGRLRAALEKIARYEYRGGKSAPTSYPDINYPAAADIALLVLDRGEEE